VTFVAPKQGSSSLLLFGAELHLRLQLLRASILSKRSSSSIGVSGLKSLLCLRSLAMEPYVADEAEEEGRPGPDANASNQAPVSEQAPPEQRTTEQVSSPRAAPRRDPTLPVRFASPVTGPDEGSTSRRRPFRRTSRDRSPPERHERERAGRESSPFFGERERQTSSPSPIRNFPPPLEEARRGRDAPVTGARDRSSSLYADISRDGRTSRAPNRNRRDSYFSEEDTIYMPSYFERLRNPDERGRSSYYDEEDDLDIRVRRARATNPFSPGPEPRHIPAPRPAEPRRYSDYYDDDDEIDIQMRDGRPDTGRWSRTRFESPRRDHHPRRRGMSEYDEWEDDQRRNREFPVREREVERRHSPPRRRKSTRADYFDDPKPPTRTEDSYPSPRVYPRVIYREAPPPARRRSTFDRGEEDIDIRVEREREPTPYISSNLHNPLTRNPFNPSASDYLIPAASSSSRFRVAPPPPPPTVAPVIINNHIYRDSDDEDNSPKPRRTRSRSRSRSRSRVAPPPRLVEPVIINNRIFDDYEDEYTLYDREENDHLSLIKPSAYSRSRSRVQSRSMAPSVAPVIINNRIVDDYEADDYGTKRWDEPDIGIVPQAYPFSLSRHSKSLHGTESIMSSTSDISDVSEKSEQNIEPQPKVKSESGRTHEVLRSQYIGDGIIGGSHAVKLALMPDPVPASSKGMAAVFRWVYLSSDLRLVHQADNFNSHFEDKTMDFDNFEVGVSPQLLSVLTRW